MQITPILEIEGRAYVQLSERVFLCPSSGAKQQLLQLARMVQENAPAFTEAVSKDMSKPKTEMYFAEIVSIAQHSLVSAEKLDEWVKPTIVDVSDWQKPWSPTIYKSAKGALELSPDSQPSTGTHWCNCRWLFCCSIKPSEIARHYSALLSELAPKYLDSNTFKIMLG
ncbi:hypothetical protein B0H14DRAFT_2583893 [Mycena olivaceomarginata]|nr:hypothetical protein B0H14DRAFT_2583893 [Mycena olivaceomarginata]